MNTWNVDEDDDEANFEEYSVEGGCILKSVLENIDISCSAVPEMEELGHDEGEVEAGCCLVEEIQLLFFRENLAVTLCEGFSINDEVFIISLDEV